MTASQLLSDFQAAVSQGNGLIAAAHQVDATGAPLWALDQKIIVTETAFLRMFMAWEKFLETAFSYFLCGGATISGVIPASHASPLDEEHANRMLVGTNKFVDWANPDIVQKIARLYFVNGVPFEGPISSVKSTLSDLRTIRNATAHSSVTAQTAFSALVRRRLATAPPNTDVYGLVLAMDPSIPGNTILKSYMDLLESAVVQIIK